jgi:hypothetical protein
VILRFSLCGITEKIICEICPDRSGWSLFINQYSKKWRIFDAPKKRRIFDLRSYNITSKAFFFWQKNLQHKVTKKKLKNTKKNYNTCYLSLWDLCSLRGFVLSIFFAASLRDVLQFLPGNRSAGLNNCLLRAYKFSPKFG